MDPRTTDTSETFVIDGYNLLHRGVGFARGGDLRDQRRRLEILLREFARARPSARVVLVYDGALDVAAIEAGGPAGGREASTGRIEVLFSRPPQSGDELVLAESARRRGAGRVVVVSSDRKDIAERVGPRVEAMSSERFMGLLEDAIEGKAPPPAGEPALAPEKPGEVSPEEVEEWRRVFSERKR